MNKYLKSVTILYFSIIAISCRKNTDNNQSNGSEFFVSATPSGTYTKELLQALAVAKGYGNYVSQIKYNVDFYKFIYNNSPVVFSMLFAVLVDKGFIRRKDTKMGLYK